MSGNTPNVNADPPDPGTAADVAAFVELLRRLREQAGNPGYKKTMERATRDEHGVPRVSGSTMHRVLENRQDLTRMREPEVFVREVVTALGADPAPWLEALDRLRRPVPEPAAEVAGSAEVRPSSPAGARHRTRRRLLSAVAAAAVVAVTAGVVAWSAAGPDDPPAAPMTGPTRVAIVLASDPGLRVALDGAADRSAAGAVVAAGDTADPGWEVVAPHRNNHDFRQLRPTGRLLTCLEVLGGSYDDRAAVQQYGCNGEPHQYWKPEPQPGGTVRWVNLHSGQCLTVGGARPQAGMRLVQRDCDPARADAQRWRTAAVDAPAAPGPPGTTNALLPGAVGPDPAEYPGGGKDRPCPGIGPGLDPKTVDWVDRPWQVREEPDATTRGRVSLGAEAFGAVELLRADRSTGTGGRETYYWAEGWVKFTPERFAMALQWTTAPGPGGWHTCAVRFTAEHGRPTTIALPRDSDHDGARDVAFRICLAYTPELEPRTPVVRCAGRY